MKILYLSVGTHMDYQSDALLHGLRQLAAVDVIDYPRVNHLYTDYGDTSHLYGRGFTMTKLLPPTTANRANLEHRIAAREFDLIIYGACQRTRPFFDVVISFYPRSRVLLIDGEDSQHILAGLLPHGLYFKRELADPTPGVYPIHFAIPTSKIGTIKPTLKSQVRAFSDPRDLSTYIYKEERDYYQDYSRSLFAFTMKKAGWDSMRTLEIMANGSIPLFLDLAQCPALTLIHLPKQELLDALAYADRDGSFWGTPDGRSLWQSLWRRIHVRFAVRSTTQALAQYVLDTQQREAALAA